MLVRTRGSDAPLSEQEISHRDEQRTLGLDYFVQPGATYVVYGLEWHDDEVWYLLENPTGYLQAVPAIFFELIDSRVSRHWVMSVRGRAAFLYPRAVADDEFFLDGLSDLDPEYVAKWKPVQRMLEQEAASRADDGSPQ